MTLRWPPPVPGEREEMLDRPDGPLRYGITDAAQPRGTVVLLHGLASNRTRWSEFVEHSSLRPRWKVIRLDLRGHGESTTLGKIGMERWSDDIAAILDREHIGEAVVVGHSLGAHVAVHFAVRHPNRTIAIALIDPLPRAAAHGRLRWAFWLAPLLRVLSEVFRLANMLGIRQKNIPPLDLRALDEITRAELARLGAPSAIVEKYTSPRADLRHIRTAHYFRDVVELARPLPLHSLRLPVLALLSRGLTFSDLATTRQQLSEHAHAEIVEVEAYHWPLTERPVEIREAIDTWSERMAAAGQKRAAHPAL